MSKIKGGTITLTDAEAEYLTEVLIKWEPSGFANMIHATDRNGRRIELCPDCRREVYTVVGGVTGHDPSCKRAIRYAIFVKLEALDG